MTLPTQIAHARVLPTMTGVLPPEARGEEEQLGQPWYDKLFRQGVDTMRHIKSEVSTINVGLAASMGSFLLCAAFVAAFWSTLMYRLSVLKQMTGRTQSLNVSCAASRR